MRIGMILDSMRGFPPDIRVEKECGALAKAGHRLFILARRTKDSEEEVEFVNAVGATVVRKRFLSYRKRPVQAFMSLVASFDVSWLRQIRDFARRFQIDILHVHDLTMLPTTLYAARKLAIPVIADLHENMPAAKRAYRSGAPFFKRVVRSIVHNYRWMRHIEAISLKRCIRTVVVVPEAAERVYGYGVAPQRVVVVSNTEDESTFSVPTTIHDTKILTTFEGRWTASYIGGIGPHRGLSTALHSVHRVLSAVDNFMLLIVGADEANRLRISNVVHELEIDRAVTIIGWQPSTTVGSYIMGSDVCLVPHANTEHTQTTIPHKLFQYMMCAKPVLVSDCRPLARVVSHAHCGRIFRADSSDSLADELIWMHDHPRELKTMGLNGRNAALSTFSWHHDARRLVAMYEEIEKGTHLSSVGYIERAGSRDH